MQWQYVIHMRDGGFNHKFTSKRHHANCIKGRRLISLDLRALKQNGLENEQNVANMP